MPMLTFTFFFLDRLSLYSPSWPQIHKSPASASRVLGLLDCTSTPIPLFLCLLWRYSSFNTWKYLILFQKLLNFDWYISWNSTILEIVLFDKEISPCCQAWFYFWAVGHSKSNFKSSRTRSYQVKWYYFKRSKILEIKDIVLQILFLLLKKLQRVYFNIQRLHQQDLEGFFPF
jgi:hypothetical protein